MTEQSIQPSATQREAQEKRKKRKKEKKKKKEKKEIESLRNMSMPSNTVVLTVDILTIKYIILVALSADGKNVHTLNRELVRRK